MFFSFFLDVCHLFRLTLQHITFGAFFYLYAKRVKERLTELAWLSSGKPLVHIAIYLTDILYMAQIGSTFFYTLMYGRRIVELLDRETVLYQSQAKALGKKRSITLVLGCIVFDVSIFTLNRWKTITRFCRNFEVVTTAEKLIFLIQFIQHCSSSVIFRLLTYGRWVTWRALLDDHDDNKKTSIDKKTKFTNPREKLKRLARVNQTGG